MLLRTFAAIVLTFASSIELSDAAPIAITTTNTNGDATRGLHRVFGRLASLGTLVGRDGDRRKATTMVSSCKERIGKRWRTCDEEEYSDVDCCIKVSVIMAGHIQAFLFGILLLMGHTLNLSNSNEVI